MLKYASKQQSGDAGGESKGSLAGEEENGGLKLHFDARLRLEFRGAKMTTDAGLLAGRELDEALGLTEMAGVMIKEGRTGRNIRQDLAGLPRQSVYARLAGYEGVNDQEGQRLLPPGREIRQAAAREMEEPGTGTPAGSRQLA